MDLAGPARAEWISNQIRVLLTNNGWTSLKREQPELHLYGFMWRRTRPVLVSDGRQWAVAQWEVDEQEKTQRWIVWPSQMQCEPEELAFEVLWWMEGPTPPGLLPEKAD